MTTSRGDAGFHRLKSAVKGLAGELLVRTRIHRFLIRNRAVVIAFHRVNDSVVAPLTCSVERFTRFCRFARQHFDVIGLGELVGRLERGESIGRALAITFDDGYEDNFEFAAPVLRALDLPATFFVVTNFIDSDTVAWWDKDVSPRPRWMSWNQVKQLRSDGFEIGAHTCNHADLGKVTGDEAGREIAASREVLESRLGGTVDLFAYPYGGEENLIEANRDLVRENGFRCCVSCCGGIVMRDEDPMRLRRVPITPWFATPGQFALEVALGRA